MDRKDKNKGSCKIYLQKDKFKHTSQNTHTVRKYIYIPIYHAPHEGGVPVGMRPGVQPASWNIEMDISRLGLQLRTYCVSSDFVGCTFTTEEDPLPSTDEVEGHSMV